MLDYPSLTCSNCGELVEGIPQPEFGLWLRVYGGYGMFFDDLEQVLNPPSDEPEPALVLCHDCSLRLFHVLPGLVEPATHMRTAKGWHPYEGDTPCCEFGWTFIHDSKGAIIGTQYGDGSREMH